MGMLAKAKAKAGATKPKGRAKKVRPEYNINGLRDYAAVKDLMKSLEGLEGTLKGDVHDQMMDRFVEDGLRTHSQPMNFTGNDVGATGNMQLRKRSSRSALKETEVTLLEERGISYTESADTVYFINKDYEGDEELMAKVEAALESIDDLPTDFLKCATPKYHTTEKSIGEVFAEATDANDLENLLGVVATLATRVKYEGGLEAALKRVTAMIIDEDDNS